jgi:DNA polymerase processivity factor
MKLSSETINVLKNFSTINAGIEFKQGSVLRTVSNDKTVMAEATTKDSFPEDFCIFDLNQFLSVCALFKDKAELVFDEQNVTIKNGKNKVTYRKADKKSIVVAGDKTLPEANDVTFEMSSEDYSSFITTAKVLQTEHVLLESDGEKVLMTNISFDEKGNPVSHTNSMEVAEGNGKIYKIVFRTDNFKFIQGSYVVSVSFKGYAHFKNKDTNIQYWVAFEKKHTKIGE